ncbi:MAG: VWA domain-containing protein [Planctomycetes bacterium]|nr:VWA domain-containing protein [Planctomycetota bacterium]
MVILQALQTETRETFDWEHLPPLWVVILVVVPAVAGLVWWIYRREKATAGNWARAVLGSLRALLILAVLLFLAQPVLRTITFQTRDPHLVVLVDDSLSMRIEDKYTDRDAPIRIAGLLNTSPEQVERTSRYGLVDRLLKEPKAGFFDRLREKKQISLYTFAGQVRKVAEYSRWKGAESEPGAVQAAGPRLPEATRTQGEERVKQTRIGDAVLEALADLKDIAFGAQERGVAEVLLFTDGQSNAGAIQPEEMAAKLKQRDIPLVVVGVGNPDPPKNIRIANFEANEVVLVGDRVPFDLTLISDGFEGQRVQVDLRLDQEVVETEYINLAKSGAMQVVRIEHKPRQPGDYTASASVEVLGGELFDTDNYAARPIKVLDQKIKVLYVEGLPRWQYIFLKNALIRDPTMEAQMRLLSADRDFIQESSPGVPALARFPRSEDELFPYHVVIIGDVDPQSEDNLEPIDKAQLELVQKFVAEAGGGVIFLGGRNANPHKYLHTPLYPLLPVEIPELGRGLSQPWNTDKPFNVKLTGAGKEHPVMRLDNDPARNVQLWENTDGIEENHLPGFLGFAEASKEKLGAVPLAVHESLSHPLHGPRLIFATQSYGKGRTFFSAVDDTWRWRAGVDNLYFYRFWGQVIRYAAGGRLLGKTPRYSLSTDKSFYTIGERVTIDAKVYDANMKPSSEPKILVYHAIKGREQEAAEKIELQQNPIKGSGSYEGTLVAIQLGSHDLWLGTEAERLASRTFTVEVPPLEFRNPQMDRERLKKIAQLAEGKYYEFKDFGTAFESMAAGSRSVQIPVDERLDDLWDEPWVLLLFTAVIAAEWILRKVVKLV